MWVILISVAIALAVGILTVIGGGVLLERLQLTSAWVLRKRLSDDARPAEQNGEAKILRAVDERRGMLERLKGISTVLEELEEDAQRAGLQWRAGMIARFLAFGSAGGVGLGLLLGFPRWFAVLLGLLGATVPLLIIRVFRHKREAQIEAQIPEALEMLVSALRAGLSLHAGMQFVGHEMAAPVGPEFARVYDEQRLGVDMRQALLGFQDRLGTVDARMVVLALLIQRETGGNLAEVLSNIAAVIRERTKFRDQVAVLTAESKVSAYTLSLLPVLLFAGLQFSNPSYTAVLTNTPNGRLLLLYGVLSLAVGMLLLNRFSRVDN